MNPVTSTELCFGTRRYRVHTTEAVDLSTALEFDGPQASHFGAPAASAKPLEAGGFVGDTRQGGSCNCEVLTLVPHCNGTHTEGVGHITRTRMGVATLATRPLYVARLISVRPLLAEATRENSVPGAEAGDRLITRGALESGGLAAADSEALIVRTLPNEASKRTRDWSAGPLPAYFTREAMHAIVAAGIEHLLVDSPSIDRTHDQGYLTGHRIFWGLEDESTDAPRRPEATVTEMIFVPDSTPDGLYALSLQVPPFATDAAPSRPLLYPLESV
jgi:hypothetical protein